jgi:cell surface protein SprA
LDSGLFSKNRKQIFRRVLGSFLLVTLLSAISYSQENEFEITGDTTNLPYKFYGTSPFVKDNSSGLYLKNPSNYQSEVIYNPETGEYKLVDKIGTINQSSPTFMNLDEYKAYDFNKKMKDYWVQKAKSEKFESQSSLIPKLHVGGEVFETIFGSNTIDIRPQGYAELSFGLKVSKVDNPRLTEKLKRTSTFDFKEKIQMNVTGKIGENLELGVNYNTEATFEFENKMNLKYEGQEDDIIQKIEAGNVSLPLPGSLISGSQSLFGILTEMQFGKLSVTSVVSQQKGQTSTIETEGGAQKSEFEVSVDEYDANRHFFLSQYFRDNYETYLEDLSYIKSPINITKVEVWVTNKSSNFEQSRNIVAFVDLGERSGSIYNNQLFQQNFVSDYPDDTTNNLYQMMTENYDIRDINNVTGVLSGSDFSSFGFSGGQDYEKIENARMLRQDEFSYNARLGFISLNSALNADEVLAVSYQYTVNENVFQVGEFSNQVDAPNTLILKLLKGTNLTPAFPTWKLMMKNIYSLGAYQVNKEDFRLWIRYHNDSVGTYTYFLKEGVIKDKNLLNVLNVDQLNSQNLPTAGSKGDGVFDFLTGITISPSNGRVIFPVLEPFGEHLKAKITGAVDNNNNGYEDEFENISEELLNIADKYIFEELYDSTQSKAQQIAEKNKFSIAGEYKSSSSSDIALNAFNIPQGSVKVTAGGRVLNENEDYTVDYMLGRVKIINQGLLQSNTPIKISLESNALFNFQTKTMLGSHFNYRFNDNFNMGATIMNLTEKPLTKKVNIGDEPISNTIIGFNTSYRTEVPFLTKMVDAIPFIETKEKSTIDVSAEIAKFIPGHNKAIKEKGEAYIDDFEGTKSSIDIRSMAGWVLSSTPQGQNSLIQDADLFNDIRAGYSRGKVAWYIIDPYLDEYIGSSDYFKSVFEEEFDEQDLFPNKESQSGVPTRLSILNLAFYPDEKGPYNYNLNMSSDGKLLSPNQSWGGLMRKITTNDFEAANVEFIEFWLMDPFNEQYEDSEGGDLYFNLGNISEDILRDSRKSFENGLPISDEIINVDTSAWGRIPTIQSQVNAFDNTDNSRPFQDVGLDGLRDEDEATFFADYVSGVQQIVTNDSARNALLDDPSQDNFHYYRGSDYDANKTSVLDRYKNYNNFEGNSPTSDDFTEDYSTVGTIMPDIEDINLDNTLSENESYYQYRVSIRKDDFEVGKNFITDKKTSTIDVAGDKITVDWYQFKIPIYKPSRVVGSISDFNSIRFLRMFLTDFNQDIVLRFAKLDLVRGEWRKYNYTIKEADESMVQDNDLSASLFDVGAVNIEENGDKIPVNYILPSGLDRQLDPYNPQPIEQNEQSIVLKVDSLQDGFSKAAYKNTFLDIRQYKFIKMYAHIEAMNDENSLKDGEISAFIRIGTDYQDNYYEYEVPLKVTPWGDYANNSDNKLVVWPEENYFDIDFEILQLIKQERNNAMRSPDSDIFPNTVYEMPDGKNIVRIKGNPNLSSLKTIMIGVRNPKSRGLSDDGLPKSAEIWLNELRLSDFDEEGGFAANARITTKLADFATVTIAGNRSTRGFGSIEKKLNERQQEDVFEYDIASNIELGKFFPEKANIRIPMYIGYSESKINPYYNPLDPDIPLEVSLNDPNKSSEDKEQLRRISQDYVERKSLNFTNVRINQASGKPKPWSVSNWSVSYAYSETFARDIGTQYDVIKTYNGSINYNFNNSPKNIMPLKKIKFFKKPALRLIGDFNFYYAPTQISFRTGIDRRYNQNLLRNINDPNQVFDPTVNKNFNWNRVYSLRYNLTKSIKFDFSANNISRIDEPEGIIDKDYNGLDYYGNQYNYDLTRDSIMQEIYGLGTTTNYNHRFNVSYNVPINKIPLLNWITLNYRYGGTYDWTKGPQTSDNRILGNTIKNSNTNQINSQFNMGNLYKKVKFVDDIKKKYSGRGKAKEKEKRTKQVTFVKENVRFTANSAKRISHNLGTEDIQVKVTDENERNVEGKISIIDENKFTFTATKDISKCKVIVTGTKEVKESILLFLAEGTVLIATGIKSISASYSETNGTILPGYLNATTTLGQQNYNGQWAPGFPFVMGMQDREFPQRMIENDWLSVDSTLNAAFAMTHSETWNFRSNIEPLPGLRIDLTANWTKSNNVQAYFIADTTGEFPKDETGRYIERTPMESGNFTMSYNIMATAFDKIDNRNSETFDKFMENRYAIAERLATERAQNDNSYDGNINPETGFPEGYGPTSQEVLILSFLSAYSGQSVNNIPLEIFPSLKYLRPNWKVTYDGLTKIDFIKKYLRSCTFAHGYSASYSVGSYATNILYNENADGFSTIRDQLNNNYLPEYDISGFALSEQFTPLIGVDMTWNNSLITKIEFKRTRNLTMSLANNQLTESSTKEFVIGTGYRFKEVEIIVNSGGRQHPFKSDLNLRADFSIRDNISIPRKLVGGSDIPTSGGNTILLKITADYVLSEKLNLRLFFDRKLDNPKNSQNFKSTLTNFGVSVRFTLV